MSPESDTDDGISRTELLESTSSRFSQVKSEEDDNNTIVRTERRGILKRLVVSVASIIGLTGAASAESTSVSLLEKKQILQKYENRSTIENVFASHEKLLAKLVDDGILKTHSTSDLEFGITYEKIDPERDTPVVRLSAKRVENKTIPKIEMIRNTSDGLVQIAVFPEHDHSFAFFNPHKERNEAVEYGDGPIESAVSSEEATTSSYCYVPCCNCKLNCPDQCPCFGSCSTTCCGAYCNC